MLARQIRTAVNDDFLQVTLTVDDLIEEIERVVLKGLTPR
jgi:hypothetical protein